MKKRMRIATVLLAGAMAMSVVGCGVKKNEVFSVDDMAGKTIGVQLGTTGDIYVTDDYKGDDALSSGTDRHSGSSFPYA